MKVELHLHTSKYSDCATSSPQEQLSALVKAGYEAVFITEHDHVWPTRELSALRKEFPAIRIFPGIELSLLASGAEHLLVLGTNDPSYMTTTDEAAVLQKARAAGHLTVLAHPFRWEHGADMLDKGLLPDALEYRTGNQDNAAAERSAMAAMELGLPLVFTGDVHAASTVNRFWIETAQPLDKAADIRRIVTENLYRNCSSV